MSPTQIVQKLWNYRNVLRDDEASYGQLAWQHIENVSFEALEKYQDIITRRFRIL
jgi:hypothetical protein